MRPVASCAVGPGRNFFFRRGPLLRRLLRTRWVLRPAARTWTRPRRAGPRSLTCVMPRLAFSAPRAIDRMDTDHLVPPDEQAGVVRLPVDARRRSISHHSQRNRAGQSNEHDELASERRGEFLPRCVLTRLRLDISPRASCRDDEGLEDGRMVDSANSGGEALSRPASRQFTWAPSIWTARLASGHGKTRRNRGRVQV